MSERTEPTTTIFASSSTPPPNPELAPPVAVAAAAPQTSVFLPSNTSAPLDLPDSAFDPTPSEVGAAYAAATGRVQANQVLRTSAMRAKDEGVKVKPSWPNTKIRIKFSDRTQIERSFPSSTPLSSVYDFVRSSLSETSKEEGFMLYQPPRTNLPEKPIKSTVKRTRYDLPPPPPPTSLLDHGLAPSSVLLIRFENEDLNTSDRPAPLLPTLLSHATELPLPTPPKEPETPTAESSAATPVAKSEGKAAGGKVPKWFKGGKK
ncbi:hypothetical protein BDY24DRAFT_376943 [Mrakia frigida]|uniref:Ubx4p n=1 Tax=Mrakia frigida TaxID=29902 RepID=UPI003FCBEF92